MNQSVSPSPGSAGSLLPKKKSEAPLRLWFGRGLRFLLPMACSVALICWMFSKVNFADMLRVLHHGVNYWWILLMMAITTLSHMIRGHRWGLQLTPVGVHLTRQALFCSIFGAYALNLLFPRLGEAWRCIFAARRGKTNISTVVGTDIGDRLSDLVVVVLLLILMIIVAGRQIHSFLIRFSIGRDIFDIVENPWIWIGVTTIAGAVWTVIHFFSRYKLIDDLKHSMERIWKGFRVLFTMPHKWQYIFLTLAIWACYFMETYVCFFAFPFTKDLIISSPDLGLLPGLVCFVFCSVSMVIPSNGGLGPWNIAMVFGLSLFGIGQTDATAFAMLMWSAQSLMLILLGLYSAIYIALTK